MTYSVYNIKVDNNLSFTPGATAGYVLAIDADGNTYWSAGGSGGSGTSGTSGSSGTSGINGTSGVNGATGPAGTGGSGSQTLEQTLALGNDVGTYSIVGTEIKLVSSDPIRIEGPTGTGYYLTKEPGLSGQVLKTSIFAGSGAQAIWQDESSTGSLSWIHTTSTPIAGAFRLASGQISINKTSANGDDLTNVINKWNTNTIISIFSQYGILLKTIGFTNAPQINNEFSPNHFNATINEIYSSGGLTGRCNFLVLNSGDIGLPKGEFVDDVSGSSVSIGATATFVPTSKSRNTSQYSFRLGDYVVVSPIADGVGTPYTTEYRMSNNATGYITEITSNSVGEGQFKIMPTIIKGYLPPFSSWDMNLSSSVGSQNLQQVLSTGNNVGTYSIIGTDNLRLNVGASPSSFGSSLNLSKDYATLYSGGVPGGPWYGSYISVGGSSISISSVDENINSSSIQLNGENIYLNGISGTGSNFLTIDSNGSIGITSSTANSSGTSGTSGVSGTSGTSGVNGAVGPTGPAGGGGGGGTSPTRLLNQSISATGWFATGSYIGYTFSNVNITTSSSVDFTPYNDSNITAINARVQPYIYSGSGYAIFYAVYTPSGTMSGDMLITPTI